MRYRCDKLRQAYYQGLLITFKDKDLRVYDNVAISKLIIYQKSEVANKVPFSMELTKIEDDEAFAARAAELFDLENMLRYALLMQGCAIADNFFNNMYMWAQPAQDGVIYRLAPWDLDVAWGFEAHEIGEEFERWLFFPVLDRMLSLDAGGIRQKAYDMWKALRGSVLNMEYLEGKIEEYTFLLGESGALMRDAERWGNFMSYPDGYELITFAQMRWPLLDEAMEMILAGDVDFLKASNYGKKAGAVHLESEAEYASYYAAVQAEAERYIEEKTEENSDGESE
jgi:hypothetical protein